MKYFAPIVVWYTAVFLHIILTLNVEEVRTLQHLQNVKNINVCYDAGPADVNMRHVKGDSIFSRLLSIAKHIALQQYYFYKTTIGKGFSVHLKRAYAIDTV